MFDSTATRYRRTGPALPYTGPVVDAYRHAPGPASGKRGLGRDDRTLAEGRAGRSPALRGGAGPVRRKPSAVEVPRANNANTATVSATGRSRRSVLGIADQRATSAATSLSIATTARA